MIGIGAIIFGILSGMLFSGVLLFVAPMILKLDISLSYYIPMKAIVVTSIMFFILFMIISLFSAGMIRKNKIMKLFRGSAEAKPEPKASIISSILAVVLLSRRLCRSSSIAWRNGIYYDDSCYNGSYYWDVFVVQAAECLYYSIM